MPVAASTKTWGASEPLHVAGLEAPDPEQAVISVECISECKPLGAWETATSRHLP